MMGKIMVLGVVALSLVSLSTLARVPERTDRRRAQDTSQL